MLRKQFLTEFLGALGAKEIHWKNETISNISGTVLYELDDPEEIQDFIWHINELEVPNQKILELAQLINEQQLLSIDKLKVSRQELRSLYSIKLGYIVSESDFIATLETLESIEVRMVDEIEETDVFFIHE